MGIAVRYTNDGDGTSVSVQESRRAEDGHTQRRRVTKDFGNSAKGADDGLIFVHGVNHGEIRPDDILPPWSDES